MGFEVSQEDKGKVRARQAEEQASTEKQQPPLTMARIQGKLDPGTVRQMQQTMGNAAVQRVLAQRSATGPAEVDEDIANTIGSTRGGGSTLDEGIAAKAGQAMGRDFGGVNVHTDATADNLSRSLSAKAFTTGSDIYFREGAYQPHNEDGQRLIAHELTHVVQQGAGTPSVQGKMTVNDPHDQYEAEADRVADTVMSMPEESVTQCAEEDEMMAKREDVTMRAEEDEMMTKREDVTMRAEEDEMMTKREDVTMRAEEDEMMTKREDVTMRAEEDEMMTKREDVTMRAEEDEMMTKREDVTQRAEEDEMMAMPDPAVQRQEGEEDEL